VSRRAFLPRSGPRSTTLTPGADADVAAPLRTVPNSAEPATVSPLAPDPAQGATGRAGGGVLARVAALHDELARAYRQLEIDLDDARDSRLMSSVETTTSPARLLTAADLGEMLQVDARTIRSWRKRGAIPAGIEIGGVLRWTEQEIDAWLAQGGRP